jgi:hypothetical protein
MTHCWQQHLNDGDYHGALQSQGRPSFTPGDGSWMDFLFRLMHHCERCQLPEDIFLQRVSQYNNTLTVQEHDIYWNAYINLCRHYQQRIQPCVYHTEFVRHTPAEFARAMAQRGDIEALDIVRHYFQLPLSWEWISLLPCTLEPRLYLHLIPWNDVDVLQEQLVTHVRRLFQYTGQVSQCLQLLEKAFQYHENEFPELQQLRDEYTALRNDCELSVKEIVNEQEEEEARETPPTSLDNIKRDGSRFSRKILHLEESLKTWQEAACNAQTEVETLGLERNALQKQAAKLQAQISGMAAVADVLQSYIQERNHNGDEEVVDFLEDLYTCLYTLADDSDAVSSDVVTQKQALHVQKLEDHVTKLQSRPKCPTNESFAPVVENVNQVSFSSSRTDCSHHDDESRSLTHDHEIQQLQETVCRLKKQLEQEAYEHNLERTGDQARIEYLLGMLDDDSNMTCSSSNRHHVITNDKDELALALEVSEKRRAQAVEKLHC